MIGILTDSTCDLPPDLVRRHPITVVPAYIHIGTRGLRDEIELTRADFYRNLPSYEPYPTTAAPAPAEFARFYRQLAEEGATEILAIHVSGSLSSMLNASRAGAAEAGLPVRFFDSGQLSLGLGLQVLAAARLAEKGASLDEIENKLDRLKKRMFIYAIIDSLDSLRRSGRVNWVQMRVGSLLQIKIILEVHAGEVTPIARVRTRQKAVAELIKLAAGHAPIDQIGYLNTDATDLGQIQSGLAPYLAPTVEIYEGTAGPAIGVHVGPGAVAVALNARPH